MVNKSINRKKNKNRKCHEIRLFLILDDKKNKINTKK